MGPLIITILMIVPYFWYFLDKIRIKNILYYAENVDLAEIKYNKSARVMKRIIKLYLIITRTCYLGLDSIYYFLDAKTVS
jgi:hypothetical protein